MGAGLEGFCSDMSFVEAVEGDESRLRCFLDCFFFLLEHVVELCIIILRRRKMREIRKKPTAP
jgi:hypothetical protein